MDWVGDNVEVVVGAVIGLIGVGAAIGIALWQHKPKRLDYRVRTNVPILSQHASELGSRIVVAHYGNELKEPRLVTVRIMNTGKQAIVAEDYVQGITIEYEANPPFEAFIARESGPGICTDVWSGTGGMHGDPIDVRPMLMNQGDWFDVQLLSDGPSGDVSVSARFKDQARPMRVITETSREKREFTILATFAVVFGLFAWLGDNVFNGNTGLVFIFLTLFAALVSKFVLSRHDKHHV